MTSSNHPEDKEADNVEEIQIDGENNSISGNKEKRKDTDGATTSKARKKSRSDIWEHFTKQEDDCNKCNCHYCGNERSCASTSGTSNLWTHLKTCKEFKSWMESKAKSQHVLNQEGADGLLKLGKVSESVFREATNEMMVIGELPLSFVESLAWKNFCSKVKLYKPHSRRTATKDIYKMYAEKKEEMKKIIEQNKQRLSLTTDIWVAPTTNASYMVITAHFIDRAWQLKKLIIGFKNVCDHKGATIAAVLLECLVEWNIKKVFTITVDNATSNSSAMKTFKEEFLLVGDDSLVLDGEFLHLRCATHILNLVVRDGMQEVDKSICAVRNGVSYVRSSGPRVKSFQLRVDTGRMTRGSLSLDCKTRWNSTFLMLSRALKFRVAFEKMEAEDKLYNDHFQEVLQGKKRVGPPSKNDWDAVERLAQFLIIFYNSTLLLSATTSVRSCVCYLEIVTIEKNIRKMLGSRDEDLAKKASVMIEKLSKYWDPFGEMNKLLIVASVFDLRNKMKFAQLCFEKLYGKDSLQAAHLDATISQILERLFEEYSKFQDKSSSGSGSTSCGSVSSSWSQGASGLPQDQAAGEVFDSIGSISYERMDSIYKDHMNATGFQDASTELDVYLKEAVVNPNFMAGMEFDVLSWWKANASKFPVLSEIARDVLAMQVSSVASEAAFSTSGRILDPYRSCLTHYSIEALMCTEQWLKAEISLNENGATTVQQLLAEIEMQDELERELEGEI